MQRLSFHAVIGLTISVTMQGTLAIAGTTAVTPPAQLPLQLQDGQAGFDVRQISISPAPALGGEPIVIDEETNREPVVINEKTDDRIVGEVDTQARKSIFHLFRSPQPRVNEEGKGDRIAQEFAAAVPDKVDRSKSADRVGADRGDCAMTGDESGPSGCEILKQDVNHYEWPTLDDSQ